MQLRGSEDHPFKSTYDVIDANRLFWNLMRNITVKEERVRILDFVAGLAFGKNCTIKKINDEGVYLINPSN